MMNITEMLNNPVFAGGMGLGIFGGIAYAARSFTARASSALSFLFTSSISITSFHNHYEDVVRHLDLYRLGWSHRSYSPADMADDRIVVGFGRGFAVFEGTLIRYQRNLEKTESGHSQREILHLQFLTRDSDKLRSFFRGAVKTDHSSMIKVKTRDERWGDDDVTWKVKRSMSTVFANGHVKDSLRESYRSFLKSEDWYVNRGLNYKMCVLLYGPPGTGKTSLIHAFAAENNLNISFVTKFENFAKALSSLEPDAILVVEDVDALAGRLKREESDDVVEKATSGEPIVHTLLNALDGFRTPHGLKVFLTTNHIDRLDPAILRDGRMDLKIEVGPLEPPAITDMFAAFYGESSRTLLEGRHVWPRTGASCQSLFTRLSAPEAVQALEQEERHEEHHSDYA